ncbi:hypothetical protein SVIOM342S_09197 [Streptomyces violaceorubidus]
MSTHQLAALARTAEPRLMLRRFLALDAAVTGANALAYLALSGPLGDYLGAGSGLLLALGAFLAVYAGCVGLLAARPGPGRSPSGPSSRPTWPGRPSASSRSPSGSRRPRPEWCGRCSRPPSSPASPCSSTAP